MKIKFLETDFFMLRVGLAKKKQSFLNYTLKGRIHKVNFELLTSAFINTEFLPLKDHIKS